MAFYKTFTKLAFLIACTATAYARPLDDKPSASVGPELKISEPSGASTMTTSMPSSPQATVSVMPRAVSASGSAPGDPVVYRTTICDTNDHCEDVKALHNICIPLTTPMYVTEASSLTKTPLTTVGG